MSKPSGIVAVQLRYDLAADGSGRLENPFFRVLGAIRSQGSIAAAARALGFSYRHLWGYLKQQESAYGRALILWDRGRAARLTEFAEKLLWAETRIQARLAGQIENLATEIGRELTVAFNDAVQIVDCVASHDLALPALRRLCQAQADLLLELRFEGILQALSTLRSERCAFAGIHLPLGRPELAARDSAVHRAFGPCLRLGREKMIRVSTRTQGLMVAAGNPRRIGGLRDLAGLRFAQRSQDTGTRALFDELIAQSGIAPAEVAGHGLEESTHVAVAAAVASGAADAGFGIEAAAAAQGLSFIPMVLEHYFLVCSARTIDTSQAAHLIAVLKSPEWRAVLDDLPGYGAEGAGEVVSLRRTLPWFGPNSAGRQRKAQPRKKIG